jgi:hypothetical protein
MSDRFPSVTRLTLHEEGKQFVYFPNNASALGQINSGRAERTTLTNFFKMNKEDAVGADNRRARSLFYEDFPTYFTWDKGM